MLNLDISLCIPTFNRSKHLDYLLNSIYEQIGSIKFSFELIISDNCSSDETTAVIKSWEKKLPIRSFIQAKNIGGAKNIQFCFSKAKGEFTLYLADDDYIDLKILADCLLEAETMPHVGIIYTPWANGIPGSANLGRFYTLPNGIYIKQNNFSDLLASVLNFHIFPEIYIFRTKIFRKIKPITKNEIIFDYFSLITEWLSSCDIFLSDKCFYVAISSHPAGKREQIGNQQAETMWDSYRGGLELLLGRAMNTLQPNAIINFREAINRFIAVRTSVAIRLRIHNKKNSIETYLLACRLRGLGGETLLPVPFKQICVAGAIEYILSLTGGIGNFEKFVLLGNFDDSTADFLKESHSISNIQISEKLPNNIKNSIILFRGERLKERDMHNEIDEQNNFYFSENILLNKKFV